MLQRVAACCQCVASVLRCVATHMDLFISLDGHWNAGDEEGCCSVLHVLQRVLQSVLQSVLQLVAECLYRIDNEEGRSAGVLQCVSACCSVCRRVAVCCFAECCSVLQRVAICCSIEEDERRARSVLQWVAMCCDVLRCVAMCCDVLQYRGGGKALYRYACGILYVRMCAQECMFVRVYEFVCECVSVCVHIYVLLLVCVSVACTATHHEQNIFCHISSWSCFLGTLIFPLIF